MKAMKKSSALIIKQIPGDIKWTDDKIYGEIVAVLKIRFENARLDKISYENPFSDNVHGTFTFHDRIKDSLHEVRYKVADNELKFDWEAAE
jgi:hypothetical protein